MDRADTTGTSLLVRILDTGKSSSASDVNPNYQVYGLESEREKCTYVADFFELPCAVGIASTLVS